MRSNNDQFHGIFFIFLISLFLLVRIVRDRILMKQKVFWGVLWFIGSYYMLLHFSEILYIEDQQEFKRFWTITAKYIFNSDYQIYSVTAATILITLNNLENCHYEIDREPIVVIQYSYYLLKAPESLSISYIFCMTLQLIFALYTILKSRGGLYLLSYIYITYLICFFIQILSIDFDAFWDFFIGYIFWNLSMLLATCIYSYGIFFYYNFILYFPAASVVRNIKNSRIKYPRPSLYVALPLSGIMSIIYQVTMEYCYGFTISFMFLLVLFTFTTPIAYLMSIRSNLTSLDTLHQNTAALFFTIFATKILFFS